MRSTFSKKAGQSDYFVVTLVLFEQDDVAELVDLRIDALRSELGNRTIRFRKR